MVKRPLPKVQTSTNVCLDTLQCFARCSDYLGSLSHAVEKQKTKKILIDRESLASETSK